MDGRKTEQRTVPARSELQPGTHVAVVEKKNYATGALTFGRVEKILTQKPYHSRGIKVMLEGDAHIVGRVQQIIK